MVYRLKTISADEHLDFVRNLPSASFLQLPSWADVKSEWRAESLGWLDQHDELVGVGLVLLRPLPRLKRYLAYLPEGPLIDWSTPVLEEWLAPMLAHLKARGAFSVRIGPPLVARRWSAEAIKSAIADPRTRQLRDVPATAEQPLAIDVGNRLRGLGWRQTASGGEHGFGDGQPRYVFQLPFAKRSLDDIQREFNQQWRRNIKKAQKAGVQITLGAYEDLSVFYDLYVETSRRDQFTPRPLTYFQRMWTALREEDNNRVRLYLAHHEDEIIAAAMMVTVGSHVWYSYGASTNHKREVQPNNAIQWRMMSDARAEGATVYDFRGITDTLEESNHLLGLLRFKVGTGGEAVEYLGEWVFPLNKVLHRTLDFYLSRR